jgi:glycosyltransferase involved in cell wall biosynthesis
MDFAKRIGFLCSSVSWGGLEINVNRLQKWLCERSLNVFLLAQKESRLYQESTKNKLPVLAVLPHRKYFDFYKAYQLSKLLKQQQIEVLFIFHAKDTDIAAWVKRLFLPHLTIIFQQHMQISTNKKDFFHTFRYSAYSAWIAPSTFLANQVKKQTRFPAQKIHIIPLGVEMDDLIHTTITQAEALHFFDIDYESEFTYCGIMGRIDAQKGQLFVVKALKKLLQQGKKIKLLMVGDKTHEETETYSQQIEQFIAKNQLQEFVYIRPFTPKIEQFYQAIDIFILASLSETYGMVTIEAMLTQKIVIATHSGGTPDILQYGKYGTLYEPNNETDFITKIDTILAQKDRFLDKAKQAQQEAVAYYSHQNECNELIELLKQL